MKKNLLFGRILCLIMTMLIIGSSDLMGQKTLPYSYGFENNDLAGEGWTTNNLHGDSGITTDNPNTGTYSFMYRNASAYNPQTIISPLLEGYKAISLVLSHRKATNGQTTQRFRVSYSTNTSALDDFTDNWTDYITSNSQTYSSETFNFSDESNIKYIAIQYDRNGNYSNMYIDDITITANNPCEALSLPYSNGFEVGDDNLSCWEIRNGATNTGIYEGEGYNSSAYSFFFQYKGTNTTQYLVTPNLSDGSKIVNVELYCKRGTYSGNSSTIKVGYSTTNDETESFEWVSTSTTLSTDYALCQYVLHDDDDNDDIKYIAIKFEGAGYNNHIYIDDISILAYDKLLVGDYWDNYTDWVPVGLPETTNDVLINRPATIRANEQAEANEIKLGLNGSLTIEDGGQLICNNSVSATFQKEITGYGDVKDNYFLIANPTTGDINPTTVSGMLTPNYDFYYFDEAEEGAEWRNYKQETFNLKNGKGYLYANSSDLTLNFPGTVPTGTTATIELSKLGSGTYAGFNLVGNPLSNNVTSMKIGESSCSYYKVNSSTGVFAVSTDPIIVGEAFMVQAQNDKDVLTLNPSGAKDENGFNNEVIRLEVSNSKFTDVAYVYFGNHLPLTKINHLNDEAPMLYIRNGNDDRAVEVYSNREEVNSINVCFEAKTIGQYTISANMVKGAIKYMHLIDKYTGEDIDMLVEDSYTFIGAPNDSNDRFMLRFTYDTAIEEVELNSVFVHQSGSEVIVEGEGQLQVFDMMGRMVMNQRVNGTETVNGLNNGVYVFRMNEKMQKVVIR